MAKLESIRSLRKIDFAAIAIAAVSWAVLTSYISAMNSPFSFVLSLFITAIFASFVALLIDKLGSLFLFYTIGAIISLPLNTMSSLGVFKAPILIGAGLIFELIFLLLKLEVQNIPMDVVLGAAISNFLVPFMMIITFKAQSQLMPFVWNLALMSFIAGLMGSIISFLIWYNVRHLKPVIKFEYYV